MVNRSSSQMVRGEKNSQYCHGHAADHIGKIMIACDSDGIGQSDYRQRRWRHVCLQSLSRHLVQRRSRGDKITQQGDQPRRRMICLSLDPARGRYRDMRSSLRSIGPGDGHFWDQPTPHRADEVNITPVIRFARHPAHEIPRGASLSPEVLWQLSDGALVPKLPHRPQAGRPPHQNQLPLNKNGIQD